MKMTVLGTGNAMVTKIYNTCFVLEHEGRLLLVDAGGGNGVLGRLKEAGIDWKNIHEIYVSHKHVDHIMGVVWMMRMITQKGGDATIYAHEEVIGLLDMMGRALLQPSQIAKFGQTLRFVTVHDGETLPLIGCETTFFDIGSTKAKQFGFEMKYDGKRLVFCGDEPCSASGEKYARGADWMTHEAFCAFGDADEFHPYEKHHSTALDAGKVAENMGVKNLILYHTEEKTIATRKTAYAAEAKQVFSGNVFVPDDLDVLTLD